MAIIDKKPDLQKTRDLIDQVSQPHRRINPCFMTGKGCVYTEHIDRDIEKRHKMTEEVKKKIETYLENNKGNAANEKEVGLPTDGPRPVSGFTIIPFKPNFLTFYELCLERFITGDYFHQINLGKADSVRKTGYVICEKICKKIQESDFVVADISVPNPNVFYELGLAYGSEQKIFLIANKSSNFARQVKTYFNDAQLLEYDNLNILSQKNFDLTHKIWKLEKHESPLECKTLLLIDESSVMSKIHITRTAARPQPQESGDTGRPEDIDIDFITHLKAALGVAIVNIEGLVGMNSDAEPIIPEIYRDWISKLKGDENQIDSEGIKLAQDSNRFKDILDRVNQAFCVLIKTGKDCHPMMYFWLGYCHARGKNVIPITEIKSESSEDNESFSDLAFDIRALWHILFDARNPGQLENALEETLYQMILNDYSEWSRKRFWDEILDKRGKVSIFTGALLNEQIGREMIGDWDLRAASELTSYFASHQYRATIESPVYHYEALGDKMSKKEYTESLKDMLRDKNCVIIASPDVNPLTEIVLCQAYGLDSERWFDGKFVADNTFNNAVVAFKEFYEGMARKKTNLTFYREIEVPKTEDGKDTDRELKRGFKTRFFTGLDDFRLEGFFIDQMRPEGQNFKVHAHLAVIPNPFKSKEAPKADRKFIVVLNGVSGPATFALTHVLTGGISEKFVSYLASGQPFDPKSESEKILKSLLSEFISGQKEKASKGVQCIIDVKVGPAKDKPPAPFDWRHILEWGLAKNPGGKAIEIGTFDITYEK